MANIFLTPTAEFKPFSYAEMLAPIAAYQEAYDAYDTQLNALAEDAATKAFNFAAQDTKEKAQYDSLMNRLKTSADALLANGLNADIMKEIRSINKDYRTSMIPLHQKIAKRAELAEAQRSALQSNPDLRFTVDYSKANLDDIHAGSTYGIINLKDIENKAALDFATKTSALPVETATPIGDSGYYNITTGFGYTPEEFEEAFTPNVLGEYDTTNPIYQFYAQKVAEIDSRNDIGNDLKAEMKEAVKRGMRAGAGSFKSAIKHERGDSEGSSSDSTTLTKLGTSKDGKIETWKQGATLLEYNTETGRWGKVGTATKPKTDNPSTQKKQITVAADKQLNEITSEEVYNQIGKRLNLSRDKYRKFRKEAVNPIFDKYPKKTIYLGNAESSKQIVGRAVPFTVLQSEANISNDINLKELVSFFKNTFVTTGLENFYEVIYDEDTESFTIRYLESTKVNSNTPQPQELVENTEVPEVPEEGDNGDDAY